jgi:hypothetical protein
VSGVFTINAGTPSGTPAIPVSFQGPGDGQRAFLSSDAAVEVTVGSGALGNIIQVIALAGPLSKQYVLSVQWLGATVTGVTTTAPFIPPYVPTYASTQPYATPAEFNNYPTGVNAMEIVPGATQQILTDTLAQLLIQASSEADGICNQVLACTTEVEYGSRRVDARGFLFIPTRQFPIVEVDDVTVGTPGQLASLPDLSPGATPSRNIFRIPYSGATDGGRVDVQITYLAGYANALLGVAVAAGATSMILTSVLGIQPGMSLRVYDPGSYENVTVSAIYGNMVTLVSPLVNAHALGVGVSAMPAAIREAVILLTAAKIKAKASESTVLTSLQGGVTEKPDSEPEQFEAAMDLLVPYVSV